MFNSQFSILIRKEKRPRFRRECREVIPAKKHLAIRHPLRMRIEHWELSIGQIPGLHINCLCLTLRYCETRSALKRSFSINEKRTPRRLKVFSNCRSFCHRK